MSALNEALTKQSDSSEQSNSQVKTNDPLNNFLKGANRGFTIGTVCMIPNVIMAFIVIYVLELSGLLPIIANVAKPVMGLWGLPGEALIVLLAALLSMSGAAGVCAGLCTTGLLEPIHVTIMAPGVFLLGSIVQSLGRCLMTSGANPRYWKVQIAISIINAMIGMWMMRVLLALI